MKNLLSLIILLLFLKPLSAQYANYTITQFLQAVDANNPDLQLALRDVALAATQKREALSLALPKIGAQGSYRRNLKRNYLFVEMPTADSLGDISDVPISFPINRNNEYAFNVVLSQTLFSFNVGYALQASDQYEQLTDEVYAVSRQGVFTWARKAFYSTLLLEEVLEITRAAMENAAENFHEMEVRYAEGLTSEFALLQAQLRWQSLLPEISRAERNLELAYNNLRQLAGWSLEAELKLQGDLETLPEPPARPNLQQVLQHRPDYNALLWEEKLRRTGVKAQRSGYYPSLDGSFIYAYSSQADDWAVDDNRNNSWIAGLTLNIPIFTGGYTSAQVQRSRLELSKNQLRLERREGEIQTELENVWLRLNESHNRIAVALANRTVAAKAFSIAENGVESGLVSQLELKDARLYYDNAQLGYYSAAWEYMNAWFDWQLALGEADLSE
ncbi:MAG: TolC family protein [Candidatus Delongbacteria bacterium]|nr:TolC family protein [Candidatus Delongbacteria bacterium]